MPPLFPALSSEPATDHAARKISRKPRSIQRIRSKATSLAKLVASRESKGIRNRKDERNDCMVLALCLQIQLSKSPSPSHP
jgi:hypothetical protein